MAFARERSLPQVRSLGSELFALSGRERMASDQLAKAASFRALHVDGILLLPNAWDSGSAAMIAAAGATVIATTSAGMSWALGRPDGQGLTRDEMVAAIARIVSSVADL